MQPVPPAQGRHGRADDGGGGEPGDLEVRGGVRHEREDPAGGFEAFCVEMNGGSAD